MTCQELLALSGALSAALPTGQLALDSLFTSLSKGVLESHFTQYPASTGADTHDVSCADRQLYTTAQLVSIATPSVFQHYFIADL